MSDLKKYRVTGPNGFEWECPATSEAEALTRCAHSRTDEGELAIMRQAGYRAEPIEEPKMVTVRADLLVRAHNVIDRTTSFNLLAKEIRAALDGAK